MNDGPYQDASANQIYQLLFCDRPELFKDNFDGKMVEPWKIVFADEPDLEAVAKIAGDEDQESRVRMLAYNLLCGAGRIVPKGVLLGTIIEVGLPEGVDTLAVFTDGGARYINHTGKMTLVEGTPNQFQAEIGEVIRASRTVVEVIGPWEKDRLPAPREGNIRMTFLVSDGLYFGEGPMELMQREQLAAPLISAATKLFLKIVDHSVGGSG
jgi:hypothetical protein